MKVLGVILLYRAKRVALVPHAKRISLPDSIHANWMVVKLAPGIIAANRTIHADIRRALIIHGNYVA